MRKPIGKRILTITEPIQEEIFAKYEYSLNYINYILKIMIIMKQKNYILSDIC